MIKEQKQRLRQSILHEMATIKNSKREKIEAYFFKKLVQTNVWQKAKSVGITRSMFPEWETQGIIQEAFKQGKRVAVPVVVNKEKMYFAEIDEQTVFVKSAFGVEEPVDCGEMACLDLVVVPGVVFNEQGYRIGFGGGYYDRFLANFSGNTIALVHGLQLRDISVEGHDRPVQQLMIYKGDSE